MFIKYFVLTLHFINFTFGFNCKDDIYKNCEVRAKRGECEGKMGNRQVEKYSVTHMMLSECRESCRKYFGDRPYPKIVQLFGGLEDHVVDDFGFKVPICSENGGMSSEGRRIALNLMAMNKKQPEWVPKFTVNGFEKIKIPQKVFTALQAEHKKFKSKMVPEACAKGVFNCEEIVDNPEEKESSLRLTKKTFIMSPSTQVLKLMENELQPLAEDWSNIKLKHSATYGIRRYTNGSWLISHVDRFNTHVISAILNVDQSVDKDWPLYILDNDGNIHKEFIMPGEMLWYESARAVHGRPDTFVGDHFDNIFIHWAPVGEWYQSPFIVGAQNQGPRGKPIKLEDIRN